MLKNIFPVQYAECFLNIDFNEISEVRIRVGSPIIATGNKTYYITNNGISLDKSSAIIVHQKLINDILQKVSHCIIRNVILIS